MSSPSTAVVTLKPRRALPFFSEHPWVFAGAVRSVSGMPQTGDPVIVRSHEGEFIAHGLFHSSSNIQVRLYSWNEDLQLDDTFWKDRVTEAVRVRQSLFQGTPTEKACRLIFSEGDFLSGLTVDRVDDWLVVQWTSAALAQRQDVILGHLQELLSPRGIWLRTERGIKELENLEVEDGLITGERPPRSLEIIENDVKFAVDLHAGQKTGFYFDQRDNRALMKKYAHGKRVLDLYTYTGSFALAAAVIGNAKEVVAVDSSQPAIDLAKKNAELNSVSDRIRFECDDSSEFMQKQLEQGEKYDVIVLDPPKFARTRNGVERAAKAYVHINSLALELLNPDGILITCSCSGHVSREDFEHMVAQAALDCGRRVQFLEQRGQAIDHPIAATCVETSYLKCFVCRVI